MSGRRGGTSLDARPDPSWEQLWEQMHDLYEDECDRTASLRAGLEALAVALDEIGETRLAKVARSRSANP